MADFEFVVDIAAPPQRVWETLIDVERWPEWTRSVISITRLDTGPLALGSRARVVQPKLIPTVWKVTEFDGQARLFTWQTGRPGVKVIGGHRVESGEYGSRVRLTLTYRGLLGVLMAHQLKELNWKYITMEAQGLKARCERNT
ncbi:MAG TPA: SRPBCC family protein [Terracidiphilus sp.]|nr:SRPBCC family protein [Terracidiphilus sp.]